MMVTPQDILVQKQKYVDDTQRALQLVKPITAIDNPTYNALRDAYKALTLALIDMQFDLDRETSMIEYNEKQVALEREFESDRSLKPGVEFPPIE